MSEKLIEINRSYLPRVRRQYITNDDARMKRMHRVL
jgi:hypothetical protein